MSENDLVTTLKQCRELLSNGFREEHDALLADEHLEKIAARLLAFSQEGPPEGFPPPYPSAECTPPLQTAWEPFKGVMQQWLSAEDRQSPEMLQAMATTMEAAGIDRLLLLLGQRRTPASLTDARAVPPTLDQLLESAARPHTPGERLSVAGRALTKHVSRSTGSFWGEVTGSGEAINEQATELIRKIIAGVTWWNVFGHFQHEVVYEARLPSGHGARWAQKDWEIIGFLEPFDEGQGVAHS